VVNISLKTYTTSLLVGEVAIKKESDHAVSGRPFVEFTLFRMAERREAILLFRKKRREKEALFDQS